MRRVVKPLNNGGTSRICLTKMHPCPLQLTPTAIRLVVGWWKLDIPGLTASAGSSFVGQSHPSLTWGLFRLRLV